MNKRTLYPLGIIFFSLMIALFTATNVYAADAGNNDVLLNMLPADCMFCVRINNLNGSLGKLDQYLAGALPIPISLAMLVNMQLGAVIGDPMLTGIDRGGDFALFAIPPQPDQKEPIVGILIPVTDYKAFVESNPNCKEGEGGVTILSDPNSPMGSFVLTETGNGKYALVVSELAKEKLPALKEAISKNQKQLAQKITAVQAKTAATAPAWAYVNLSGLYDKYNEDALEMLTMTYEEMAKIGGGMEDMMGFASKIYAAMFTEFASEADSATIALTPEPAILSIDIALQAKDGTELAQMLVADTNTKVFSLTRYLDNNNAVNGLMKMNRPSMQKFYDKMFDIMEAATDEAASKEQTAKMKALTQKMLAAMGDEVSFSYSYAGSTPPFKLQEVVEIRDAAAMKALMSESEGIDYANTLYKDVGIPAELKYEQGVSTYKGAIIDVISISMGKLDDPNDVMQKEFEKIYGGDFKYYMAQTSDKFFVTMGPDSEQTLKALIDQPASASAPSGDIKIAMDALQNTPYDDFVCSINIIKLMQGMGEMMQTMGTHENMGPGFDVFSGMEGIQSQSCLVMGGTVSDGGTSLRIALPKQHLVEVVTAVMQIQQQAMAATDQKLMEVQQKRQEVMQIEQQVVEVQQQIVEAQQKEQEMTKAVQEMMQNPLQSWVGRPAPELKMVDLDGKIHRVSRLKGKKVILDFWATWCPPCKKAIPDLIKLADSNGSDLVILGLSNESTDKLTPFAKGVKINYPIIAYHDRDVPAPYNKVTVIPTLFLIDSEGIIQDVLIGYHEPEELQSRLKEIK
ncbi:MAG: TlpA family protein disulfide reductase [Planctomycetes bacterium]|nr:TlpA family protein disulfide reductase [Planctomycetota bacterium]